METIISKPLKIRTALIAVLLGITFYFEAKIGYTLSALPDYIPTFWLSNALILATLLLTNRRRWWIFFLVITPIYLTASMQAGFSVQGSIIFYTANCTGILVAALALQLILKNRLEFDRIREMIMFLFWAVFIAPLVSAFGASMITFVEPAVNYWLAWRVSFFGNALGYLTLTPAIILWISSDLGLVKRVSFVGLIELLALGLCLLAVGFFSLGAEIEASGNFLALLVTPLPVLLWAAIRFGLRGICSAVFVITLLASWNAINGRGPFTAPPPADNVLSLQLFLIVISIPIMLLGSHLSSRKETVSARQKSEAHLRTLIDTLPDLVWLKDPDGVYLACNPKFERFFGAKESEIRGKTDHDFVDKELADFFREKDKVAMAAGKPSVNEEEVTYADDGHREMLETIKTPMYGNDGSLIGVLGIARDITERKEAEQEREGLIRRLEKMLVEIKTLRGILPLCSFCKKVRNDKGYWEQVDVYIHKYSEADISHSICPECMEKYYTETSEANILTKE